MKSLSRCCICCIELHQGKDKPPLINRLKLNLIKHNTVYKITKIVCVLWLAERHVCMRVCKHGCDIKMFCFLRTNHASTNLKKVFLLKTSTSLLYSHISSSAETWKIFRNMLCQFFFAWADILSEKKTVFWKASFLQNKDWLRVQALCTRLRDW